MTSTRQGRTIHYDHPMIICSLSIHISTSGSLALYPPPVTQREMQHEGYSDAITPPTTRVNESY